MRLTALDVRDVRVIAAAALEPGPGLNLVVGANGAGKTSLLEAIHVLATGRPFAATRTARLVRRGAGPLRVVARAQADGGGPVHRLGLERGPSGPATMRVDGRFADRVADLARLLPVVAIHPDSHELIAGGPGARRRLLDLGLFHVEPRFHGLWERYRRALAQRNVLLRRGTLEAEVRAWDGELARAGEVLDAMRRRYVADLDAAVQALAPALLDGAGRIELVYRRGWAEDEDLADALGALRGRDLEQRVSGAGPHRAELAVRLDGRDVRQRVSRGEQKLLVYLLRLGQARQLAAAGDGSCVLLLDDLPAELDAHYRRRVLAVAAGAGAQCFVTALERGAVPVPEAVEPRLFHVEQGTFTQVVD